VLSRDQTLMSKTDDQLRKWDELARRVEDGLTHSGQGNSKCVGSLIALGLMVLSASLVLLWFWLGAQLGQYVSHYLMLDCTGLSCACWSILAVTAAALLAYLVHYFVQSVFRRFETLRTTALTSLLVEEVKTFVDDWDHWEAARKARVKTANKMPTQMKPDVPLRTDAFADDDDDDEPYASTLGFLNFDEMDEPEPDLQSQVTMLNDAGAERSAEELEVEMLMDLSLEKLTALSADKLHVDWVDAGASRTDMWSDLSTHDFDRFSLELSRVASLRHRKQMLAKWKELRINEMLARQGETGAQSPFCCCSRTEGKDTGGDYEKLTRQASLEKKEKSLADLWETMVRGRVERERQIIELRAELIARLESGLKKTHGVDDDDEEAPQVRY
jgi:hypothetical protein